MLIEHSPRTLSFIAQRKTDTTTFYRYDLNIMGNDYKATIKMFVAFKDHLQVSTISNHCLINS